MKRTTDQHRAFNKCVLISGCLRRRTSRQGGGRWRARGRRELQAARLERGKAHPSDDTWPWDSAGPDVGAEVFAAVARVREVRRDGILTAAVTTPSRQAAPPRRPHHGRATRARRRRRRCRRRRRRRRPWRRRQQARQPRARAARAAHRQPAALPLRACPGRPCGGARRRRANWASQCRCWSGSSRCWHQAHPEEGAARAQPPQRAARRRWRHRLWRRVRTGLQPPALHAACVLTGLSKLVHPHEHLMHDAHRRSAKAQGSNP